jgi:hypothetical protein
MMADNRATGLGDITFRNEDEYQQWTEAAIKLGKDFARELEDAAQLLRAKLAVTPVVNSGKAGYDPRAEHKTQAAKVGKSLMRAATAVAAARNDIAAANQIFLQYWTKDGGLETTTKTRGKGRSDAMELNHKRRRTTKTA